MLAALPTRRALLAALIAFCTLALPGLAGASGAAAAPGPGNLAVADPGPLPTFSWGSVGGATGYVLEADNDPDFSSRIFSTSTVQTSYVHFRRLPGGTIHWRVRARTAQGESEWSTSQFVATTSGAPTNLSPDRASVTPPVDPPVLRWDTVPGATTYRIEVAGNDTFTSPSSYQTRSTSFVVPSAQGVGTYYWRVRADFGEGNMTSWSTVAEYTVTELPLIQGEDVTSPPTDRPVQDVVLEWAPVRGASRYEVEVATDRSFNEVIDTRKGVLSTRYSPDRTYPNNDYFWRVRAVNSAGQPTRWASSPLEFRRAWSDRAALVSPADDVSVARSDPLFYEWTPVSHAQRYRLEVGSDPSFSPGSFQVCTTSSTTYTPGYISDACKPSAQGSVYYWRVLAIEPSTRGEVPSLYSAIRSFIYDAGPVVRQSPAPGATVDVPTLSWAAHAEANRYTVTVRNAAGGEVARTTTHALSWTPRTALKAADGPFTWRVVAIDQTGSTSPDYGPRTFSLSGSIPDDPEVPDLTPVQPAPSARFPALRWEPVAGAAHYRIEVGVAGTGYNLNPSTTGMLTQTFAYPALTDDSAYFLSPQTYRWRVSAYSDKNVHLGTGPYSTFTITDLPQPENQRIALTGTATSDSGLSCRESLGPVLEEQRICTGVPSTPVLRWDPVPGADSYMVYLAEDRDLTQLVYGNSASNTGIPVTENTMWTPTSGMSPQALPDNESGEAYFWYIRPCKAASKCATDPLNTDDAASHAFRKISPQITPVSPAADAVVANQVTFTWKDYLITNADARFPQAVQGAPSSHLTGDRYRIQVFTDPTANQAIDDQVVDQTTYTPWRTTYPEGPLWWRVQAIDAAGNGLAWMPLRRLNHETPYQNLNSRESLETGTEGPLDTGIVPGLDQRSAGDTALRWTARPYDTSWNIEIYRNDDTTGSPAHQVYRGTTVQAAFTWTNQLAASPSAYRWRIQRRDAGGRPGAWSDWGRFFVRQAQVEALQPGTGLQPSGALTFSWKPVTDAATYRLEVVGDAGGGGMTTTTAATSWAHTAQLPTGRYAWRVKAFDATGQQLGASPDRTFLVDSTAPRLVRWQPTTRVRAASNFVAVFDEPVANVGSRTFLLKVRGRSAPLPARVTLSADGRTATLNPAANLGRRKTYTATLKPSIKDAAGNNITAFSWSVTTR